MNTPTRIPNALRNSDAGPTSPTMPPSPDPCASAEVTGSTSVRTTVATMAWGRRSSQNSCDPTRNIAQFAAGASATAATRPHPIAVQ